MEADIPDSIPAFSYRIPPLVVDAPRCHIRLLVPFYHPFLLNFDALT